MIKSVDYTLTFEGVETKYIITTMNARKAISLKVRILNMLSKDMGSIDFDSKDDMALGLSVVGAIFGNIDADKSMKIIDELVMCVQVNDGEELQTLSPIFDTHFSGHLLDCYKLLWKVLEVNYPDFLGEGSKVRTAITRFQAKRKAGEIQKEGKEPTTTEA